MGGDKTNENSKEGIMREKRLFLLRSFQQSVVHLELEDASEAADSGFKDGKRTKATSVLFDSLILWFRSRTWSPVTHIWMCSSTCVLFFGANWLLLSRKKPGHSPGGCCLWPAGMRLCHHSSKPVLQNRASSPCHHVTMQPSPTVQCHSGDTQMGCYTASVYFKLLELNKHEEWVTLQCRTGDLGKRATV